MTATWTFDVTGMHCASCGLLVDEELEDLPGVLGSTTSVRRGRTVVRADTDRCTPERVVAAVGAVGYTAVHRPDAVPPPGTPIGR